jgi:hypothetical protein
VSDKIGQSWECPINQEDKRRIVAANGTELRCFGSVEVLVQYFGRKAWVKFYISPDVTTTLMSWKALAALGVIHEKFPMPLGVQVNSSCVENEFSQSPDIQKFKKELIESNPSVFDSSERLLPMKGDPIRIHLHPKDQEEMPKPCTTVRQIPVPFRELARCELEDMIAKGIIRPVHEPTEFCSPFLVVPKPDGGVRLVVDFRQVNKLVQRPIHVFPSIAQVKSTIPPTAKWFASMLRKGTGSCL